MTDPHERMIYGFLRLAADVGSNADARGALGSIVGALVGELGLSGACFWRGRAEPLEVISCAGEAPPADLASAALHSSLALGREGVLEREGCLAWPLRVDGEVEGVLTVRGEAPPALRAILEMLAGRGAHILRDARGAATQRSLLGGLSHELRAPLQTMLGHLDLLCQGSLGPLQPDQAEALDRVAHTAEKILAVIDDVLQVARIDAGADEAVVGEVALAPLLAQEIEDARPLAKAAGLELAMECPDGLMLVTDGTKLRRILTNLLSNAVKYTSSGGITLRAEASDSECRIEVRDTGIGIPKEQLARVFLEYVRLDPEPRGTGLGLSIARRLAGILEGRLTLTSSPGEGTTAVVVLPIRACPD